MHTTDSPLAEFTDRLTMVYERHYPHDIELVWEAVSTDEHLNVWLLPVTRVERRVGGRASFTWGSPETDGVQVAEVTVFDPPSAIEYSFPGEGSMRFDLEPDGDGTRLRFTHAFRPGVQTEPADWPGGDQPGGPDTPWKPGFVAGFHAMLDDLRRYLVGEFTAEDRAAHLADPESSSHLGMIDVYREHIRETIPPA